MSPLHNALTKKRRGLGRERGNSVAPNMHMCELGVTTFIQIFLFFPAKLEVTDLLKKTK